MVYPASTSERCSEFTPTIVGGVSCVRRGRSLETAVYPSLASCMSRRSSLCCCFFRSLLAGLCVHVCARARVCQCARLAERGRLTFSPSSLLPPSSPSPSCPTVVFLLLADPVKRRTTSLKSSFSLFFFFFFVSLFLSFAKQEKKKEKIPGETAIDDETMHRKVRVNVTTFGRFADSVNHQRQHRRS